MPKKFSSLKEKSVQVVLYFRLDEKLDNNKKQNVKRRFFFVMDLHNKI